MKLVQMPSNDLTIPSWQQYTRKIIDSQPQDLQGSFKVNYPTTHFAISLHKIPGSSKFRGSTAGKLSVLILKIL